ncbi:hypothetical protein ACWGBH_37320 [Streptomyces massasporeus]
MRGEQPDPAHRLVQERRRVHQLSTDSAPRATGAAMLSTSPMSW